MPHCGITAFPDITEVLISYDEDYVINLKDT